MPGVVDFVIQPGVPVATWPRGQAEGIYRSDPWDWVIVLPDDAPTPVGPFTCQLRERRLQAGETAGDPLAEVEIETDGQRILGHLDPAVTTILPARWYWDIQDGSTDYTLLGGMGKTFDDISRAGT